MKALTIEELKSLEVGDWVWMEPESGEMIDTTKYFYEKEKKPNGEYRYLICKYDTVSKGIYDFCNTLSEAERRLAELKGE